MSKNPLPRNLDPGHDLQGCCKINNGQYGCSILTKGRPLSETRMVALREGSKVASLFLSEEPYTYEFGRL